MTKTTSGSFIVWCEPFSDLGESLNSDEPTYEGQPVCILQVDTMHHDGVMVFELIYTE